MKVSTEGPGPPITYHDYVLLPQDRNRYEVLDGELYMTPSPTYLHQWVVMALAAALHDHASQHGLGAVLTAPIDVVLSETTIVQPDILFIGAARVPAATAKNITTVPELIVEVVFPSSAEQDRVDKMRAYARHGVPHYWIADPDAKVLEMYALSGGDYALAAEFRGDVTGSSPLFPGLAIPLARLWL